MNKVSAKTNSGLQDDHDPSDIAQQSQNDEPHDEKARKPEAEAAYPRRDPAKKKTGEF